MLQVPLFNSELAPAEIRGRLISFNQIAMTGGILVAFWINFALQDYENGWRYALAGQCVPALLLLVSCLWIPRSPRWLVQQGLIDEARLTLVMLRPGKTIDEVHGELAAIESSVMEDKHNDSWSRLLTDLGSRRRLLVGMGMQSGQNLTGINAIMYYAPSIFQSCGFSGGLLAQGINGWVNFLATLWAFKVWLSFAPHHLLLLPCLTRWSPHCSSTQGLVHRLVMQVVDDYGRRQLLLWGAAVSLMHYGSIFTSVAGDGRCNGLVRRTRARVCQGRS